MVQGLELQMSESQSLRDKSHQPILLVFDFSAQPSAHCSPDQVHRSLTMRSLRFQLILGAFLLAALTLHLFAPPAWWAPRDDLTADSADDYAVLNQGQLKKFMRGAIEEMNASLPGGAGAELNDLLAAWRTDASGADDFAIANQGQLKAMGGMLRARLAVLGISLPVVGSTETQDDEHYAPANLGQAKHVFNVLLLGDLDSDGINDTWEMAWFGNLLRDLRLDTDGDGFSDAEEYAARTDPISWQSRPTGPGADLAVFTQIVR